MEERFKDIERLVKEAGLEVPSATFLSKVMYGVENTRSYKKKECTPLISRKSWIVSTILLICWVCLALLIPNTKESIFSEINFSLFNSIKIGNPFLDFKFYKATLYGVMLLAFLFFIQLPFLKRRIDKNFS